MASFNLADYATVNERLQLFWEKYPNGRITTDLLSNPESPTVVIRAQVWKDVDAERQLPFPDSTGHARESHTGNAKMDEFQIERGETSAIGRALAIMGFAISKSVASRQEMEKVARVEAAQNGSNTNKSSAAGSPTTHSPVWGGDLDAAVLSVKNAIDAGKWTKAQVFSKLSELGVKNPETLGPRKALAQVASADDALQFLSWLDGDFTVEEVPADA